MDEVDILLVEDRADDIELIREALKEVWGPHRLEVATDGEQALSTLVLRPERPHIVILDLNLPKISGIEVLRAIKKDPHLKLIPTIVLTNSESQEDVAKCYGNCANAFIRKPVGFDRLTEKLQNVWQFWVNTAILVRPSTQPSLTTPPPSDNQDT